MSDYKQQMQSNNVDLQAALDLVRTLPDKGVEVETVSVSCNDIDLMCTATVTYTNVNLELIKGIIPHENYTITDAMKGTICIINDCMQIADDSIENVEVIYEYTKNDGQNIICVLKGDTRIQNG